VKRVFKKIRYLKQLADWRFDRDKIIRRLRYLTRLRWLFGLLKIGYNKRLRLRAASKRYKDRVQLRVFREIARNVARKKSMDATRLAIEHKTKKLWFREWLV
jgi:hypothetical protein